MASSGKSVSSSVEVRSKYDSKRRDSLSSKSCSSEYSGASGYSSRSDSTNSLTPPSALIRFAKKFTQSRLAKPQPSPVIPLRNVEFIRIQGRADGATVYDSNTVRTWDFQVTNPSPTNLVNTVIGTLEVTGLLTAPLIKILSGARMITTIAFKMCHFLCSSTEFSSMIQSVSSTSLTFIGCKFSDAQLIGDRLFTKNKQLVRIVIGPSHKEHYSFPCLTDASLRVWRHTVPVQIHFTNVISSITAKAVADVAKRLTSHQTFSWSLGRIPMESLQIRTIFGTLPLENVEEVVTVAKKVHILYWNQSVIAFNCKKIEQKKTIMYSKSESAV